MQTKLTTRCAALLFATAAPLAAQETWTPLGVGDWASASNWSTGVPDSETATVNNGGTAQIGSAVPTITGLFNNTASSVQVNNSGAIRVTGDIDNSGGTLTVNNSGTLTFTGQVLKGGNTIVNAGGTLNVGASDDSSWGRIGNGGFGTTNFSIVGGTVNAQFTEGDGLVLGDFEHTTNFNMSSGGTLNMAGKGLKVAWWKAGNATVTADASTINFTQDGSVDIGAGGDSVAATGAMILQNSASLIKVATAGEGSFTIGAGAGTKANIGSLTVNSGSTIDWQRGEFVVGNDPGGTGTMTLNGGTVTTHSWTAISRAGASGHLIINGGTMNVVGDAGGHMQVTTADGGTGVVDINGGTLNVTASGGSIAYQHWGQAGVSSGVINLNGGRLIAGNIYSGRGSASGSAVFNFNGGILQPNGGNLLHDLGAVYVKSGGAIIDSAGNGGTAVNMPLLDGGGGGGLVIRGNGTDGGDNDRVQLRADNTYTGGLTIENGAYVNLTGSGDESGVAGTGNITLNGGGFKNWDSSNPTLSRQITLGPDGGYFTIGWGDKEFTLTGKITGAGGLFVNRDGGHLLVSNPANDYSGDTRLGADGPGRYSDGNQAGLYLGASQVIPDGPGKGNLIIDGGWGGHLNMNGFNETINGLSDINGGRIYNSSATDSTLSVGNNNATSSYGGAIESNITLTKIGTGTLTLTGTNSHTKGTVVSGGILQIAGDAQLGAVPGSPAVNITLDGGQLFNNSSSPVLDANRTIHLGTGGGFVRSGWAGSQSFTINGKITGPGGFGVVWDGAPVILGSTGNDYAGDTTIGTDGNGFHNGNALLRLGADNALPFGSGKGNLNFGTRNTPTLDLNGHSAQINGLNGGTAAVIDNQAGTGPYTLTIGNGNAGGTFEGTIQNTSGSLGLTKVGNGIQTLSGTNTFTGTLLIDGGTVALTGTASVANSPSIIVGGTGSTDAKLDVTATSSTFTVAPGQTISGIGAVIGNMNVTGVLAPGNSIGTLTITGNLTLAGTSDLEVSPTNVADLIDVSGLLTFGGTLSVSLFGAGSFAEGDSFDLFDWGTASGTFSTVNLPTLGGGLDWDQSQLYSTGTIAVIPEPRALALFALAAAAATLRTRRRTPRD